MHRTALAVLICVVSVFAGKVVAHDDTRAPVLGEATIEAGFGSSLKAFVDLEGLPAGEKVPVKILLHNDTGLDIPIQSMSTTCSCLKLKATANKIGSGGYVEMVAELDVPKFARSAKQNLLFNIFYSESKAVVVQVRYGIKGLVSFSGAAYSTKVLIGQKKLDFEIPILVTAPFEFDDLVILADESLGEMAIEPITRDGSQFLRCKAVFADSRSSRSGLIRMSVPGMQEPSILNCVLGVEKEISVAPEVLRFIQSDGKLNRYSSQAIVKIHDGVLFDKRGRQHTPVFSAALRGGASSFKAREIAKGFYRVEVTYDREEGSDEILPKGFECKVRVGNRLFSEKVRAVFLGS